MKILLSIIFLFTITNLQADLIVKRKKNFTSCQEVYETGNYKGEGVYKIKKDGFLQDLNCIDKLDFQEEYNYYNGSIDSKLIVEKIQTQEYCNFKNLSNLLEVTNNRPVCIVKANKNLKLNNDELLELEFEIYRNSYSQSELVKVNFFNILEMNFEKNIKSGISIGNINENEINFYNLNFTSKNKIKLIKQKEKYFLYLNDNLIDEKNFDFNLTQEDIIIKINNTGVYINNINIKIYKINFIENYDNN